MINFKQLHKSPEPLIICNVWDVNSAKIAEKLGFKSIGTSSAAIATSLGYSDGEEISFDELYYIVQRIIKSSDLPLSVDIEAGYGKDSKAIIKNIEKLIELGVVGINIEDSYIKNNSRKLVDLNYFIKNTSEIIKQVKKKIFINIRTDTYLLNIQNKLQNTIERIKKYEMIGADGVFIPCLTNLSEIEQICQNTNLPVNLMCFPDLPDFETLKKAGVKRISMGNFIFESISKQISSSLNSIIENQNFNHLFDEN